jgi:protein-disulfide isomerase
VASISPETLGYVGCFLLALAFMVVYVVDQRRTTLDAQKSLDAIRLPSTTADVLLDDDKDAVGDKSALYTLAEFGDYECPPCRGSQPLVTATLQRYRGTLKMRFYNLPLTQIHPLALAAAEFAEAARLNGGGSSFWQAHDKLYNEPLDQDALVRFSTHAPPAAKAVVDADVALANRLGVTSTPTFILCTPDGAAYKLPSLDYLQKLVH